MKSKVRFSRVVRKTKALEQTYPRSILKRPSPTLTYSVDVSPIKAIHARHKSLSSIDSRSLLKVLLECLNSAKFNLKDGEIIEEQDDCSDEQPRKRQKIGVLQEQNLNVAANTASHESTGIPSILEVYSVLNVFVRDVSPELLSPHVKDIINSCKRDYLVLVDRKDPQANVALGQLLAVVDHFLSDKERASLVDLTSATYFCSEAISLMTKKYSSRVVFKYASYLLETCQNIPKVFNDVMAENAFEDLLDSKFKAKSLDMERMRICSRFFVSNPALMLQKANIWMPILIGGLFCKRSRMRDQACALLAKVISISKPTCDPALAAAFTDTFAGNAQSSAPERAEKFKSMMLDPSEDLGQLMNIWISVQLILSLSNSDLGLPDSEWGSVLLEILESDTENEDLILKSLAAFDVLIYSAARLAPSQFEHACRSLANVFNPDKLYRTDSQREMIKVCAANLLYCSTREFLKPQKETLSPSRIRLSPSPSRVLRSPSRTSRNFAAASESPSRSSWSGMCELSNSFWSHCFEDIICPSVKFCATSKHLQNYVCGLVSRLLDDVSATKSYQRLKILRKDVQLADIGSLPAAWLQRNTHNLLELLSDLTKVCGPEKTFPIWQQLVVLTSRGLDTSCTAPDSAQVSSLVDHLLGLKNQWPALRKWAKFLLESFKISFLQAQSHNSKQTSLSVILEALVGAAPACKDICDTLHSTLAGAKSRKTRLNVLQVSCQATESPALLKASYQALLETLDVDAGIPLSSKENINLQILLKRAIELDDSCELDVWTLWGRCLLKILGVDRPSSTKVVIDVLTTLRGVKCRAKEVLLDLKSTSLSGETELDREIIQLVAELPSAHLLGINRDRFEKQFCCKFARHLLLKSCNLPNSSAAQDIVKYALDIFGKDELIANADCIVAAIRSSTPEYRSAGQEAWRVLCTKCSRNELSGSFTPSVTEQAKALLADSLISELPVVIPHEHEKKLPLSSQPIYFSPRCESPEKRNVMEDGPVPWPLSASVETVSTPPPSDNLDTELNSSPPAVAPFMHVVELKRSIQTHLNRKVLRDLKPGDCKAAEQILMDALVQLRLLSHDS